MTILTQHPCSSQGCPIMTSSHFCPAHTPWGEAVATPQPVVAPQPAPAKTTTAFTAAQVEHWFEYHAPTPEQVERMKHIRRAAKALAAAIAVHCPSSADTTAAMRKLREAVQTANAAIVLEQT